MVSGENTCFGVGRSGFQVSLILGIHQAANHMGRHQLATIGQGCMKLSKLQYRQRKTLTKSRCRGFYLTAYKLLLFSLICPLLSPGKSTPVTSPKPSFWQPAKIIATRQPLHHAYHSDVTGVAHHIGNRHHPTGATRVKVHVLNGPPIYKNAALVVNALSGANDTPLLVRSPH